MIDETRPIESVPDDSHPLTTLRRVAKSNGGVLVDGRTLRAVRWVIAWIDDAATMLAADLRELDLYDLREIERLLEETDEGAPADPERHEINQYPDASTPPDHE